MSTKGTKGTGPGWSGPVRVSRALSSSHHCAGDWCVERQFGRVATPTWRAISGHYTEEAANKAAANFTKRLAK